jgi:hypothetical protein
MTDHPTVIGRVQLGGFYRCRDGRIVGPMIDTGTWRYEAALGAPGTRWDIYGWSSPHVEELDIVEEAQPPVTWTGDEWSDW